MSAKEIISARKWRKYIHYINDSRQTSYGLELMLKPNWEASPDAVIVAPDVVPDDDAALLDKELLDAALLNDEPLDAGAGCVQRIWGSGA